MYYTVTGVCQFMMQVALIRGINVGTAKRVAMADLRAALTRRGLENVGTLLNTGNVVFSAAAAPPETTALVAAALREDCKVEAHVTVLTAEQFASIMARNALVTPVHDPSRFLVTLYPTKADRARFLPLASQDWTPDALQVGEAAVYAWCAAGALDSPLAKALTRVGGQQATTRNWATMVKLQAMLM